VISESNSNVGLRELRSLLRWEYLRVTSVKWLKAVFKNMSCHPLGVVMTTVVIHKNMIYADCKMTTVLPRSEISAKHFGTTPKEHESETIKIYLPPEGIDPTLIKVIDSEIIAATGAGSVDVITDCISLMWEHGFNYLY